MIAMIEFYGSGQRGAPSLPRTLRPECGQWGAASQHLSTCVRESTGEDPCPRETETQRIEREREGGR